MQSIEDSIAKAIAALTATKTVVHNSDWNLLSNVLVEIIKAAKAVEDTLFVEIQGWEIEIGQLKGKIAEYKDKERSEFAMPKAIYVKKSIESEKEIWLL